MSPDQDPTRPQSWLKRARSNLARARLLAGEPEVVYEDLCFDAQQAAEKALKAVLVHQGVAFPKTHALADLLTFVARTGVTVPAEVRAATLLTPYAVEARYPGLWEEVTVADHQEALSVAQRVVAWAEQVITGSPAAPR
jgi:HEPN domain-containing protein